MLKTRLFAVSLGLCSIFAAQSQARDMFTPSANDQVKLGLKTADEIRKKEKVLPDSDPRTQIVKRVGKSITDIIRSEEKGKPWHYTFDVIDSKQVNAFALPGGPMFVYTGLLEKMKTEDELAAVLGHELTHVRREHWAKQYGDGMKKQLGAVLLLSIFKAGRAATDVTSLVLNYDQLHFSRKDESQADEGGFDTMVKAGFNPVGMVDTFKLLKKVGGNGGPEWMSDHPDIDRRINDAQGRINKLQRSFPALRPMYLPHPAAATAPQVGTNPQSPSQPPQPASKPPLSV